MNTKILVFTLLAAATVPTFAETADIVPVGTEISNSFPIRSSNGMFSASESIYNKTLFQAAGIDGKISIDKLTFHYSNNGSVDSESEICIYLGTTTADKMTTEEVKNLNDLTEVFHSGLSENDRTVFSKGEHDFVAELTTPFEYDAAGENLIVAFYRPDNAMLQVFWNIAKVDDSVAYRWSGSEAFNGDFTDYNTNTWAMTPTQKTLACLKIDYTPNTQNGVDLISTETSLPEYYSLDGMRLSEPQEGLNIVRENGKTRKVIIRK